MGEKNRTAKVRDAVHCSRDQDALLYPRMCHFSAARNRRCVEPRDVTWTQHWNGIGALVREHLSVVRCSIMNRGCKRILLSQTMLLPLRAASDEISAGRGAFLERYTELAYDALILDLSLEGDAASTMRSLHMELHTYQATYTTRMGRARTRSINQSRCATLFAVLGSGRSVIPHGASFQCCAE